MFIMERLFMPSRFLDRVSNKALGEMLIEKGALSPAQVDEALEVSREKGVRLGEALVLLGYITRDALGYAIGEQYGLQPMELQPSMVDTELVSRFDHSLLSAHTMLPLIEIGNEMVVVVSDPNDQQGLAEFARILPQHNITPQLGTAEQIQRCLQAVKPESEESAAQEKTTGPTQPRTALELRAFDEVPDFDSPELVEYLLSVAASNPCRDVILREIKDDLQLSLGPSCRQPGDSPEAALTHMATWTGLRVADVRHVLLQRAGLLEHTRGQAARWKAPVALDGKVYDILILMPILGNTSMVQLRALQHLDLEESELLSVPLAPDLEAGKYTVVLYDEAVPLERALAQFMEENAASHTFVVCQLATRCVFPHAQSYPAPYVNMVTAVQAASATCAIIDHPVEYRDATRLLTSTYPPPAVLVCAPMPSHEGGAGSLSPDVEELMARQGAQSVRLNTSAKSLAENTTRGNN